MRYVVKPFDYTDHKAVPFDDSGPLGFVARYAGPVGEVTVCFLVLDMSQSLSAKRRASCSSDKGTPPRASEETLEHPPRPRAMDRILP